MSITSLTFLLFVFALLLVYYLIPRKLQWCVLLLANAVFYAFAGWKAALFVLFTATSIYFAARGMDRVLTKQKAQLAAQKDSLTREEKKAIKRRNQKRRKRMMLAALLANIGILCVTKYTHFALAQVNALLSAFGAAEVPDELNLIVPLGISFYTFQSVGYLLDVYWEKIEAERHYLKFLLFVSFFPQMTQGPISSYEQLSGELFAAHSFSYKNYSYGMQRMLWGFAKKLLVADVLSVYVTEVFANYEQYSGLTALLGAFFYAIQIYADFSGYMDIMCGLCEALGIRLRENFDRPYFSKSIAEYWRRWHISLGDWFKNYVYYPIGMSDWSRSLAKKTKQRFGAHIGNTLPATIALVLVWTATGLWHGASWGYLVWGLLNGVFIILSLWMEPVYAKWKARLKIHDQSRAFRCFQILRTFVLVTFIKVLPEVGSLRRGLGLWKHIFTAFRLPTGIQDVLPPVRAGMLWLLIATAGTLLMLTVSILQGKYRVRDLLARLPIAVRILLIAAGTVAVVACGGHALYVFGGGGFLYAGF